MREIYSVRCIFEHRKGRARQRTYEERVTVWRVDTAAQAIAKAEAEAKRYARTLSSWGGDWPRCRYLGYAVSYETSESTFKDGLEVFSLMRDSAMKPGPYVGRFFDTGKERCRPLRAKKK